MAQTVVNKNPAIGVRGQISSTRQDNVKITRASEGAVQFGYLVARGTNRVTQAAPVGAAADVTDDPLGIVVNSFDTDADSYADNVGINILRSGTIYVIAVSAATAGDPVLAADADGAIHGAAAAGRSVIPGAVFLTSPSVGAIAEIELNLVGQ